MIGYAYSDNLSYSDHLRLRDSMGSAGRATARELSKGVAREMRSVSAGLEQLSDSFSAGMRELSAGLDRIDATLDWGFSAVLAELGGMHSTLHELVQIAKTPAQTAAYEHFEQARANYRKGLYPECLDRLNKAIEGDRASSGFQEEWRFYQLKGTVYLECPDRSMINLPEAERNFLIAARYAQVDHAYDAAGAFLAAGWAAYCQGKMKQALQHTMKAHELAREMGEAYFQAAKIHLHLRDNDELAVRLIRSAIDVDIGYAARVPEDGECQNRKELITPFWKRVHEEVRHRAKRAVRDAASAINRVNRWTAKAIHFNEYASVFREVQNRRCLSAKKQKLEQEFDHLDRNFNNSQDILNSVRSMGAKSVYELLLAERDAREAEALALKAELSATAIEQTLRDSQMDVKTMHEQAIVHCGGGAMLGLAVGAAPLLLISSSFNMPLSLGPCSGSWLLMTTVIGCLVGAARYGAKFP